MVIAKHIAQKPSSRSLTASSSLLGLAAGAVGWSGLAQAAGDETSSQVLLLPEHYELMDNGVVVFKLETGENLSLTADQYLILEDGLLLITDELAQASVYSLPVMGSVRAQLLSELEQVATIDGTVAEATPAQTLSITEGQAPRLSEQVELQSYEIAQAGDGSSSEVGEAVAVGLSVSPVAMALLGMLQQGAGGLVFTSGTAVTFAENGTGAAYTATATHANGHSFSFSIKPGKDAAAFSIDAGTGILTFVTPPDYEAPTDLSAGGVANDNIYVVDLEVRDGNGVVANQTVSVTVTDVGLNLIGTANNDLLSGSAENDVIRGLAGNDNLYGYAGPDFFDGGLGVDNIALGPSDGAADKVSLVGYSGVDRAGIWEFETGIDKVAVTNTAGVPNGTSPSALVSIAGLSTLAIDHIIADSFANLGANAVNVGDVSHIFTSGGYAYVTDGGNLLYDADGDFTAGVEIAGYIFSSAPSTFTPSNVVASDFEFGL